MVLIAAQSRAAPPGDGGPPDTPAVPTPKGNPMAWEFHLPDPNRCLCGEKEDLEFWRGDWWCLECIEDIEADEAHNDGEFDDLS